MSVSIAFDRYFARSDSSLSMNFEAEQVTFLTNVTIHCDIAIKKYLEKNI